MTFLFIATIGPVQPFIASARRTRDLYVGSTLLSELSKAAAYTIAQQDGRSRLIFPAPLDEEKLQPGSLLNVANKIVAIVQHSTRQEVEKLGKQIYKAIQDRLDDVKKKAFGNVELANSVTASRQIEHLVEYSWVAVSYTHESEYPQARERAEAILGARKHTHFFGEVTWGNDAQKSSIDGQRECVIPPRYYHNRKDPENSKRLYKNYKAGPHEHLSAVDLLKRLAWRNDNQEDVPESLPLVLSTSHIAATPFLDLLEDAVKPISNGDKEKIKSLWNEYIDQVEKLAPFSIVEYIRDLRMKRYAITENVDGALLFKERLLEDVTERNKLTTVNLALDAFFSITDKYVDSLRPCPYYGILLADGDGMGKVIEAQTDPEQHQDLSRKLADFAGQIRDIVNKTHHGSLIYSGGDDVLALLPLHTAIPCAKALSETFKKTLDTFKDKDGNSPTLSVGIAVVHHVSLLEDALELARAAERYAKAYRGKQDTEHTVIGDKKKQLDKNALAIIVKKRGGETNEMVVSWDDQEARLQFLIDLYNADIIPDGMAYELRTMMERLQTSQRDMQDVKLQEIVQFEAARILRRKLYFSRDRAAKMSDSGIEQKIFMLLERNPPPPKIREKLTKPQDQARFLLLQQIGVLEHATDSFEVVKTQEITWFVNALIVAQTFTEAIKPMQAKGDVE